MAYEVVALVRSEESLASVIEHQVRRTAERFGITDIGTYPDEKSIDFHVPFPGGADGHVEVDLDPSLIEWYAQKHRDEKGSALPSTPNVVVSWTISDGKMDEEVVFAVTAAIAPGTVVTAHDHVAGFDVEWHQ